MIRIFAYFFLLSSSLSANSLLVSSLTKAKKMASLYKKPILSYCDANLSASKRKDLAIEIFSHPLMKDAYGGNYIFTQEDSLQKDCSGIIIYNERGKKIGEITSIGNINILVAKITDLLNGS